MILLQKSQIVDLSSSLNDSSQSTQSSFGIKIDKPKANETISLPISTSANTSSSLIQNKKKVKKTNSSTLKRITNRPANNISFDNNSSASSDLNSNLNDESSETSGRFTAVSTNLINTSPNQSSDYLQLQNNSVDDGNKALDNLVLLKNNNNRKTKYHKKQSIKTNQESNNDSDDELDVYNNSNSFNSNEDSSIIMDKMVGLSIKTTSTSTANTLVPNYYDQHKIDNEINKLRKESGMFNNLKNDTNNQTDIDSSVNMKSKKVTSTSSTMGQTSDHSELADSSLKASNHFDNKIKHIENYSQIIEKATLEMDACVKDMNIVYENYEKIVGDENEFDDMSNGDQQNKLSHSSVYDTVESKVDIYKTYNNNNNNENIKQEIINSSNGTKTNKLEFYLSSTSSIQTTANNASNNNLDDNSSYKFDKDFDRSSQATSSSTKYSNENENYFDCLINVDDLKQDIKQEYFLDEYFKI